MHFKEFSFMVLVIDSQVAGVSGDMLLCGLVNIGANRSKIIDGIRSAESLCKGVKIKKIDFVEVKKNSLQAIELLLEIDDDTHERKGIEIKEIIEKSAEKLKISESAKRLQSKLLKPSYMQNQKFTVNRKTRCTFMRQQVLIRL